VYLKNAKYSLCVEEQGSDAEANCRSALELPPEGTLFSTGPIERMFEQKLGELGDPGYVSRFKERYSRIERTGQHDFTTWDSRDGKKK
jgi:hypothetical protein